MWNLVTCKPSVEAVKRYRENKNHKDALNSLSTTLDNKFTTRHNHVYKNLKKKQLRKGRSYLEKRSEIRHNNKIMMNKIVQEAYESTQLRTSNPQVSRKLDFFRKDLRTENKRLAYRILSTSSDYSPEKLKDFYYKHKKISRNISKNSGHGMVRPRTYELPRLSYSLK